ncbi:MAG: tetratricopeptide repeat protein [Acidobacteria bacterium]|nr:tetratricopeptide repeat protein [Acidobacteriota bacterium]
MNFEFVLDDHSFTADPRIQDSGHIGDYFANYVWAQFTGGPPSFYRPVFLLWMRINFALSSLSPWGWHLLSIAKHVLVAAILGLLIWELLLDRVVALVAGTLFALHPAQTESVSWVTVPDPLMSAGMLGALLMYLRYLDFSSARPKVEQRKTRKRPASSVPKPSLLWLMGSAGMYFTALLSKETAIVFPAVIGGIALCIPSAPPAKNRLPVSSDFRARLAQAVSHMTPFLGVTVLYLFLRFNALGGKFGVATQHLPWRPVMLSWPATIWFYLKVMLWPVRPYSYADPTLVERFSVRGVLFPSLAFVCCAAIVAALSFWVWRRSQRELGPQQVLAVKLAIIIGVLLLVVPLVPALDFNALNPGDFLHGRYTYLPLAGLMLLIASWYRLVKKFRVVCFCIAISLTIVFAILTFSQEAQWKDDSTLFTTAHRLAPHNAPVAQNLANTHVQEALKLVDEARCSEAIPVFDRVIQDYPKDWLAWGGLGVCYVQLNDLPKAEQALYRAADLSHNSRVIQQWQELRAHMRLSNPASLN